MAKYFFKDTIVDSLTIAYFIVRACELITRYTGKSLNSMKKLKNGKKA
jgi:hypothetical protein